LAENGDLVIGWEWWFDNLHCLCELKFSAVITDVENEYTVRNYCEIRNIQAVTHDASFTQRKTFGFWQSVWISLINRKLIEW